MREATDFAIYQRNENGLAKIPFAGGIPDYIRDDQFEGAWARAVREEDGLEVVPWKRCDLAGRDWRVVLSVPQGGLYRLEAAVGDEIHFHTGQRVKHVHHVGVGELYLVAGQSNMAGYGRDFAYDPPELGLASFGNDGKWHLAAHPLNSPYETVYPENCETGNGSSPALSFARGMKRGLGVPIGLVQASLGGSPLSAWNLAENGVLTKAMFRRLEDVGPVGGLIWYQGCSDTDALSAKTYLERFAQTAAFWRERLGDIPIITVQLNRYLLAGAEGDHFYGLVREAQRLAPRHIPKVCVVPALDMPLSDNVHNSSGANVIIGERMAQAALAAFYNRPGAVFPDLAKAVQTAPDTVELVMTNPDVTPFNDICNLLAELSAEDAEGLVRFTAVSGTERLILTAHRPLSLPATISYAYTNAAGSFPARSRHNLPMLAFYQVPIENGLI